jgi:hypothetical protein
MTHSFDTLYTCRQLHLRWAGTLLASEGEVDQLLSLLTDLTDPATPRNPARLTALSGQLQQLKTRIYQLRSEVVCSGGLCSLPQPPQPCPDAHFVARTGKHDPITDLATECSGVQDRCQTVLSELMGLNLI